jgi:hypothetical protein
LGGTPYWQGAGQLFWRNPATGLFGAYSAATQQQGVTTWRFGPEAELYLNRATLSAVGGWKLVSGSGAGMFLQAKASFYLTPDFKLFGGYIFDGGSFGNAGFEFRLAGGGLAFFGEGRFGSSASGAWVGLRAYLGGPPTKSLIDRDRQDVAPLWIHLTEIRDEANGTTLPPNGTTPPQTTPPQTTPPNGTTFPA